MGIEALMKSAGMTHGGFYNHFASKGDLAVEVLRRGFTDSLATLDALRSAHPRSARAALHDMVGALLVSPAVVDVAPDLSDEVLGANRSRLKAR